MNDLAEKALEGLDVAYRAARSRALVTVGVIGFGLGVVIVFAAGRVGASSTIRPLTTWFGIQDSRTVQAADPTPASILLIAVVALVVLWLVTVEVVRRRTPHEPAVWGVFAAWAAPFAVGPPLFDPSVYSYAAFGLIQRAGHDPYTTPPSGLGFARVVEAVDPGSRGVQSSAGPLGTLVQHLAASVGVGSALGIVIVLRVVAVVAVVWIGRTAADMGGRRPARALSLTVLNPLLLFYVISAARLEGLMTALALAAVAAANRRSWGRALVLAAAAASVLGQALVVVAAIIVVHVRARGQRTAARVLLHDVPIVAVAIAVFGLIVPNGFGWIGNVDEQFSTHTPFSVSDGTSTLLRPVMRGAATYDTLTASSRVATLIAMGVAVVALLVTTQLRPLERTAGYLFLAVGLLAPTLYPWYVIAGVVCIAPSSNAVRKIWVLGISAAACLLMPGGFMRTTSEVLTAIGLASVALVTGLAVRRKFRLGQTGEEPELPTVVSSR